MKHTKGKWTAVKGEYGLDIDANEGTIATIYANDGEAKANANLIASAPEMLETLKYMKREEFFSFRKGDQRRLLNNIDYLIDKAEGKLGELN